MTGRSLDELKAAAAAAHEPILVPRMKVTSGGVDPLGLRQTNFNLMDLVFPGVNNVGSHIRPYVVVAWAWRRAITLAKESGASDVSEADLLDFVDRIETIYAWSQFMLNAAADLPGGDLLRPWVAHASRRFGGDDWKTFQETRRTSTGLTAPITYGPALKMLGWIAPHERWTKVMAPLPHVEPALDAFEACIERHLHLPIFNKFGDLDVQAADIGAIAADWALDQPTPSEQKIAKDLIFGDHAVAARRQGGAAMIAAVVHSNSSDPKVVRRTMVGRPSNFAPSGELVNAVDAWRCLQVRQLFRLSLEALLYWSTLNLGEDPRSVESLAEQFLREVGADDSFSAAEWIADMAAKGDGDPVGILDRIGDVLAERNRSDLASAVAVGFCLALAEAPPTAPNERGDRLPLAAARKHADARANITPKEFVQYVLESWVFAQHIYWAVGRGLADARGQGKSILRLKVMLEEGGWMLAFGAQASRPSATPDRLATMLSLAEECGLLTKRAN